MNSIFHRVSIRKYEDRPVEQEKLLQILKAGMQAPSACNQQPWEFYVVTDKEMIQKAGRRQSLLRLCGRCASGHRAGLPEGRPDRAGLCADRSVYRPGAYLAGDGRPGAGRRCGSALLRTGERMDAVHRLPESCRTMWRCSPCSHLGIRRSRRYRKTGMTRAGFTGWG